MIGVADRRSPSSTSRSTTPSTSTGRCARSPRPPRPARPRTSSRASPSASSARSMPVIAISIAILTSYKIGAAALPGGGLFGTAVATMGMLGTAAYILAMDTFGPITDNAGGIVEMSQQPEEIRKKTDRLDAVGNTTKALTKGYAIGSAALAAFLLFSAYLDELKNYGARARPRSTSPSPRSSSAACSARCSSSSSPASPSRRSAGRPTSSSRTSGRSSRRSPGIMQGTEKPDYGRTVDIVTRGRARQMVAARPRRGRHADRRRAVFKQLRRRGRSRGGPPDGRHDRRHPHGDVPEQRRRRLGQRQEVHRDRAPYGGQGLARRTRPRSWATPSAIRSRTPRDRRCTC